MNDEAEAKTEDLQHYFESGETYFDRFDGELSGVGFGGLEALRSVAIKELDFYPAINSPLKVRLMLAQTSINNDYVETAHDVFIEYSDGHVPVVSAPSAAVSAALKEAGLESANSGELTVDQLLQIAEAAALADDEEIDAAKFEGLRSRQVQYRALLDAGLSQRTADAIFHGSPLGAEAYLDGRLTQMQAYQLRSVPSEIVASFLDEQITIGEAKKIVEHPLLLRGFKNGALDAQFALSYINDELSEEAVALVEVGRYRRALFLTFDDETRAAASLDRDFEAAFGSDRIDGDALKVIESLRSEEKLKEARSRLAVSGVSAAELDERVADLKHAAQFYSDPGNKRALARLDSANDEGTDSDGKIHKADVTVRLVQLTASPSGKAQRDVRSDALRSWSEDTKGDRDDLSKVLKQQDSNLGHLTDYDQTELIEGYLDYHVDGLRRSTSLKEAGESDHLWSIKGVSAYNITDSQKDRIASSLTRRGLQIQKEIEDNGAGGSSMTDKFTASVLVTETLALHTSKGTTASFISNLENESTVFVEALHLDEPFTETVTNYWGDSVRTEAYNFDDHRQGVVGSSLDDLSDEATSGGTFDGSQLDFVSSVTFLASPTSFETELFKGEIAERFPAALARANAIAGFPGDSAAQSHHEKRLLEIFSDDGAIEILATGPEAANFFDRLALHETLIEGRPVLESSNSPIDYWTVDDFDGGPDGVHADLTVDLARETGIATAELEKTIRDVSATKDGKQILGFGPKNDSLMRSLVVHGLSDGTFDAADFDSEGSGFSNKKFSSEYFAAVAVHSIPNVTSEQIQQAKVWGASDSVLDVIGLESDTSPALRVQYLGLGLEYEWPPEAFSLTDDFMDNDVISHGFATDHFESYGENGVVQQELAALDPNANDYSLKVIRLADGFAGPSTDVSGIVKKLDGKDGRVREAEKTIDVIPFIFASRDGDRVPMALLRYETPSGKLKYLDSNGNSYDSSEEWLSKTNLPGRVTFPASSRSAEDLFQAPVTGYDQMESDTTDANPDSLWESPYVGWAFAGVGTAGGAVVIFGSGGLASPIGYSMMAVGASYPVANSALDQYDHLTTEGEWTDSRSIDNALQLAGGAVEFAPGVTGVGRLVLTKKGAKTVFGLSDDSAKLATRSTTLRSRLTRMAISDRPVRAVEFALTGNSVVQVAINENLSGPEKAKYFALFGAPLAAQAGGQRLLRDSALGAHPFGSKILTEVELQQNQIGRQSDGGAAKIELTEKEVLALISEGADSPEAIAWLSLERSRAESGLDLGPGSAKASELPASEITDFVWESRQTDPAWFRSDFDQHVLTPDVNPKNRLYKKGDKGGFSGGHNADEFWKAFNNLTTNPNGPDPFYVDNVVRTPIVDSNGATIGERIEYRLPKLNPDGKPELDVNGRLQPRRPDKEPPVKSVYDPTVISDAEMNTRLREIGMEQLRDDYDKVLFLDPGKQIKRTVTFEGVKYQVVLKLRNGQPVVDNVHLLE